MLFMGKYHTTDASPFEQMCWMEDRAQNKNLIFTGIYYILLEILNNFPIPFPVLHLFLVSLSQQGDVLF